jgi:uroporphyrinogen-III decarboxylase
MLGVTYEASGEYHFAEGIGADVVSTVAEHLGDPLDVRSGAQVEALRHVAGHPGLVPIGMCIGPFSLMTKLLADPIAGVYMAGAGVQAVDDPDVQNVERALALAEMIIARSLRAQIQAGAKAVFLCEPAANVAYISPKQLDAGSDVWERFVMAPNRRLRKQLGEAGVDLIFHCCGEICERMLVGFAALDPAILSLGSSRQLWEDAELMPETTVLYGNLPTKRFFSDALRVEEVARLTRELLVNMRAAGHPHILGSECDVLSVAGSEAKIREKVAAMMSCPGH